MRFMNMLASLPSLFLVAAMVVIYACSPDLYFGVERSEATGCETMSDCAAEGACDSVRGCACVETSDGAQCMPWCVSESDCPDALFCTGGVCLSEEDAEDRRESLDGTGDESPEESPEEPSEDPPERTEPEEPGEDRPGEEPPGRPGEEPPGEPGEEPPERPGEEPPGEPGEEPPERPGEEPPVEPTSEGPTECSSSADCALAGACPPDAGGCECVETPDGGRCIPVCVTDADCPAPPGMSLVCADTGICVPEGEGDPSGGEEPPGGGEEPPAEPGGEPPSGEGGAMTCTSSSDCSSVESCPVDATRGCDCLSTPEGNRCLPLCSSDSDCPTSGPMGALVCAAEGFCVPSGGGSGPGR